MPHLKKKFSSYSKFLPILFIVVVVIGFFWKTVFFGLVPIPADFIVGANYPWLDYKWGYPTGVPVKNPITSDVVSFIYPMKTLALDLIKKGQLPLWNPYVLAGTPLLANFQSAPFSPTNLVYFLFDKTTAWGVQIILQHLFALLFTYLLLRRWRRSKVSSLFGGIIYAFSGFNLIWSQWNGIALTAAIIPLTLLFVDKWLEKPVFLNGLGITLSIGALFLSGYPQMALYLFLAIALLWLIKIRKTPSPFYKTIMLGVFSIFGIGIAGFQILPGWELLKLSQRGVEPHPFEWAFLPYSKIITFIAPDYYGNHATGNYWGPQDYSSNIGFVGLFAFVFATIAISLIAKKENVFYLFCLVFLSLLLSFPSPLSIYLWQSGAFGLNAASAHRALVLFNLSVGCLAAYGLDYAVQKRENLLRSMIPALTILLLFGGYALSLFISGKVSPEIYPQTIRGIHIYSVALRNMITPAIFVGVTAFLFYLFKKGVVRSTLFLFIILFFTLTELFRFGWKFTPFSPRNIIFPQTPIFDYLEKQVGPFRSTGTIPVNMRMVYKIESLEGYDAVYPLTTSRFIAAINDQRTDTNVFRRYGLVDNLKSPLLNISNVKYFVVKKLDTLGNPSPEGIIPKDFSFNNYSKVFDDKSVAVLINKRAVERAILAYYWENLENDTETLNKMLTDSQDNSPKIYVKGYYQNPEQNIKGFGKTEYLKYSENESIIDVKSEHKGILFVSDSYYPGWKAYIDGKETTIYKSNFAFRGIPLEKGNHIVHMEYQPESFVGGVKISLVSLISLTIVFLVTRLGKHKDPRYTDTK